MANIIKTYKYTCYMDLYICFLQLLFFCVYDCITLTRALSFLEHNLENINL